MRNQHELYSVDRLHFECERTAVKEVTCQHCQAEYLYVIERTAIGQATTLYHFNEEGARDRSQTRAQTNLQVIEKDFDLVPCPNCGSYQPQMVAFLRRTQHFWMFLLAVLLFLLSALALIFAGISALIAGTGVPGGILA